MATVGVPGAHRRELTTRVLVTLIVVVSAALGVVVLAATGILEAGLGAAARQMAALPHTVFVGGGLLVLVVALPAGAWEAGHLRRLHQQRTRQRRIMQLTPLGRLLGLSPLDFERATVATLYALTPGDFERAVGLILGGHQYTTVQHTGGPHDLCADLAAVTPDGKRIVVQCKRYALGHHVTVREMQQFLGMVIVHHRVPYGLYVTTSSYTPPALKLAQEHRDRVRLVDGPQLVAMARALAVR
jgi:HJR/Mrr/RecB family endonuclease